MQTYQRHCEEVRLLFAEPTKQSLLIRVAKEKMPVTVKLFAHYRDLLGKREISIPARPGLTVADVYHETIGDQANAELRKSTIFAVNEVYVPAETVVNDGDRVAFIPPVSGG